MPWHVGSSGSCPSSKPFAVIKTSDGSVAGCHPSREAANAQMAALYASEEDGIGHQPSGVKTDLPGLSHGDTPGEPPPYTVPSGQVAIGEQVPWQDKGKSKTPVPYTTPTTQIWLMLLRMLQIW